MGKFAQITEGRVLAILVITSWGNRWSEQRVNVVTTETAQALKELANKTRSGPRRCPSDSGASSRSQLLLVLVQPQSHEALYSFLYLLSSLLVYSTVKVTRKPANKITFQPTQKTPGDFTP